MKGKKYFGIMLFFSILMIGVYGCAMNKANLSNKMKSNVLLSERQKVILSEQGLSTRYEDLSITQKQAIVSIEEMLSYVEDKYGKSFSYAGYVAKGPLEEEHMRAYPADGYMQTDSFTIIKKETGYEDDYINIAINVDFADYVNECIQPLVKNVETKVFCEITKTSLSEIPMDFSVFDGNVESSLWVFLDSTDFEEDFESFKIRFSDVMNEHKLYGMAQIIFLKEGKMDYITRYNYTDYLSEEYYTNRGMVYINK